MSENQHGPLHAFGLPPRDRLQRGQDIVEAIPQIVEHVITIHADTMAGVHGGSRPSHEDGSWYEVLQMPFGGEQPFPIRKPIERRLHGRHCDTASSHWRNHPA